MSSSLSELGSQLVASRVNGQMRRCTTFWFRGPFPAWCQGRCGGSGGQIRRARFSNESGSGHPLGQTMLVRLAGWKIIHA